MPLRTIFEQDPARPDSTDQCGSWLACDGGVSTDFPMPDPPPSQASQLPHFESGHGTCSLTPALFPESPAVHPPSGTQRIVKIRRDYNTWVADETMEDYALRYTPKSFRKWSELRIANTALGAVSFLALEAIGGVLALNYGFTNTFWAILAISVVIFLTGLPISYYAARYGVDMDLLTRGAGFGYIGSTITSLIYASFTFLFFALEAAIMALALELYFHIPLALAYVIC